MSLAKAVNNLKFDKRLTEWCINNGQMTKEEHKKYIETLPDLQSQVDLVHMDEETDTH